MMQSASRILILANPISGKGQGQTAAEDLADLLDQAGEDVQVEFTRHPGHGREIAAGLEQGVGRLAVVGGDGTLGEVLSGLTRFNVPIAVLPTGTANLLGRTLGLSRKPEHTASLIQKGSIRRFDMGRVGGRCFVSVAGVGFDAQVVRELEHRRRGSISKFSYLLPTVHALRNHRPIPLTVEVDGQVISENSAWVVVCNVKHYAAYFQFTPDADPTDGLFDLCVLHDPGRWSLVLTYLRALRHRRRQPPAVTYPRGRRIKIWASTGAVPYELDGDYVGETPVQIEMTPAAVPFLVP